ncbi:MAG TPA: lmo0937 family membrane protein [Candidatus Angelobacter sp.]|nr:lmo0937 family membrane protein [Candidatus Angelobacter sp.]
MSCVRPELSASCAALDCLQPVFFDFPSKLIDTNEGIRVLWTAFVILLVLWLLGVFSSYTFGGLIHILLVLALIALIFQIVSARRTRV